MALKSLNRPFLWAMILFNALLFWGLLLPELSLLGNPAKLFKEITVGHASVAAGVPLIVIILTGLLPVSVTDRLVFWRWRFPLPGCRAFTTLSKKDARIDLSGLEQKHGELPTDPRAQNVLWYRIYKSHETRPSVVTAHQSYLLTRDATAIAVLIAAILGVSGALLSQQPCVTKATYFVFLIVQYLLLSAAARNYGTRLVLNALAEESAVGPAAGAGRERSSD